MDPSLRPHASPLSLTIKGFPTFPTTKWFVDGEDADYTGGRTEAEIVSWIGKPRPLLMSAGSTPTIHLL